MKNLYKNHLTVIILMYFLIVILAIVLSVFLYLKLNPVFGGHASKKDKSDYAKRAENYVDGKFSEAGMDYRSPYLKSWRTRHI